MHAGTDGGALFCDNCQSLTLQSGTALSQNDAEGSGGAIYCDGVVLVTITDTVMSDNMWAPCICSGTMHKSGPPSLFYPSVGRARGILTCALIRTLTAHCAWC